MRRYDGRYWRHTGPRHWSLWSGMWEGQLRDPGGTTSARHSGVFDRSRGHGDTWSHGHMVTTGTCIRIRATSCYTPQKYPRLSIKKFSTFPAPFLQSGRLWHASQVSEHHTRPAASLQPNKMRGLKVLTFGT